MREILFRGKAIEISEYSDSNVKNGDWVKGSLLGVAYTGEFFIITEIIGSLQVCGECACPYESCKKQYVVDPATVGQFTGLCDKNGVKIFEGDIVDIWSAGQHCHGLVKWGQGSVSFFVEVPCTPHIWHLSGGGKNYDEETCEVIGNIHEHNHLLG